MSTQDFLYLRYGEIAFLEPIVKMGREAHTGLRAEIDENFAG